MDHWSASEPEALSVWIRLLCEANYEDKKASVYGKLVDIKRGQLVFGLDAFSARSGVSVKKLRRIIDMLIKDGMLGRQVFNKFSVITITCYDKYQDEGKQEASTGQAEGKQRAAPKEDNNLRSEEDNGKRVSQPLDYSSWPAMPSDNLLAEWKALRKKQKAPISQVVINRTGKELHKAASSGFTVDQCFEQWIYKGWRGFEAEWVTGKQPQQPVAQKARRAFGE